MLVLFKDSFHWGMALRKYALGDFNDARSELYRIRGDREQYSEYFALLGTLHLLLMNHKKAKKAFQAAMNGSTPRKLEYRDYIDLYCNYYISVMHGDERERNKYLERALSISTHPIMRRWLPLSRIDVPNGETVK